MRRMRRSGLRARLARSRYRMKSRGQKRMAKRIKRGTFRRASNLAELKYIDKTGNSGILYDYRAQGMFVPGTATALCNGVPPAGCTDALNAIPTGTSANQRIGKKIFMKTLQIRGWIQRQGETSAALTKAMNSPVFCRMMIVYDKQCSNSTNAPAGSLLQVSDNIYSVRNLDNADRFAVLLDETFCVNPGISGNTGTYSTATFYPATGIGSAIFFERFIKINLPTTYNTGTTGVLSEISTGALHCYTYTDGTNYGTAANVNGGFTFRLRYVDA